MKKTLFVLSVLLIASFAMTSCGIGFTPDGTFYIGNEPQSAQAPAATQAPAIAAATDLPLDLATAKAGGSASGDFVLEPNTLGEKPAANENVDPQIYKKPYEAGTITDAQGNGIWAQSGKDGSAKLMGSIPEGSWLEIDAFILSKSGKTLTGGNLIVVAGPLNLDTANLTYTDGGANLVKSDLQAFLDDNVWGKFCRGNIAPDGKSFTYKPWALKNIQLPEGITFKSLSTCPKNASEDKTTIPTLP